MAKTAHGSKPDKLIRDSILIELNRLDISDGQKVKKIHIMTRKLVALACEGKIDAISLIMDRVEGKAVQGVALTDTNGEPLQVTWRLADAIQAALPQPQPIDAAPHMVDITPDTT